MSFRDFTIQDIKAKLGLSLHEDESLYEAVAEQAPSAMLAEQLRENVPLAIWNNTEKARSELIITPVLLEVRRVLGREISFFSGKELNVDAARGLVGVCDFLLSLSPERLFVSSPILVVAEAKNLDMAAGIPQCLAEMVAAQELNRSSGAMLPAVHGVVTTGSNWRFMRLEGADAWVDSREHYLHEMGRILGILCELVRSGREALAKAG